jgi:uncharacterized membrane protein YuzA (DUF378 family)
MSVLFAITGAIKAGILMGLSAFGPIGRIFGSAFWR